MNLFAFLLRCLLFSLPDGVYYLHGDRKKKVQNPRKRQQTKPVVPGSLKDRILKLQQKKNAH